jgi:hypothetical protein
MTKKEKAWLEKIQSITVGPKGSGVAKKLYLFEDAHKLAKAKGLPIQKTMLKGNEGVLVAITETDRRSGDETETSLST